MTDERRPRPEGDAPSTERDAAPTWSGTGPRPDLDDDEKVERQAQPTANDDL